MRIEEMRSGRAYLGKRPSHDEVSGFEPHDLGRIYPSAPVAERPKQPRARVLPQTDLEKNQWTVVSFDGVEAGGLTYDQATRLITALGDSGISGLCIITDVAALNID